MLKVMLSKAGSFQLNGCCVHVKMELPGARPIEPASPLPAVTTGPAPLSNHSACVPTTCPSVKPDSKDSQVPAGGGGPSTNVAVTVLFASMVMFTGLVLPMRSPDQPLNVQFASGTADNCTTVPTG